LTNEAAGVIIASMLKRFFRWRASKRMGRTQYRLDRRHYRGIFQPGFFAHLNRSKFWEHEDDPVRRQRKNRRKLFAVLILIALGGLGWLVFESIKAFRVF